jgi:hypothetical protein
MLTQLLPLYNHNMGVILIGVFALVCVALIVMLVSFMNGGKKKK